MFESKFLTWITSLEHPILNLFHSFISIVSHEYFYFIMIPFIFWCIHKAIGFQLLYLFVGSMYANNVIKDIAMIERPLLDSSTNGYSFPSGHTQAATTFWGFLIPVISRRSFTILAILMITLVAFFRLHTGAHWPIDIIGALGIGLFLIYMSYRSLDWIGSMPDLIKLILAIVVPIALFLLSPENGYYAGILLGSGLGYILEQLKNRMEISSHFNKKLLAFIIGLIGIIGIQTIGQYLPDHVFIEFILASSLGLWITLIAPILFVSLRIYNRKGHSFHF